MITKFRNDETIIQRCALVLIEFLGFQFKSIRIKKKNEKKEKNFSMRFVIRKSSSRNGTLKGRKAFFYWIDIDYYDWSWKNYWWICVCFFLFWAKVKVVLMKNWVWKKNVEMYLSMSCSSKNKPFIKFDNQVL